MATDVEVERLRELIAEPDDALPWTDSALKRYIDEASGNLNLAAANVWTAKAASAADLVDVSEGGSSRKLGDLHEQALAMAQHYASLVSGGVGPDAPRFTRISRLAR